MSHKLSSRIVPELAVGLRDMGLLTSLVTLDSPRFKHYLKKPANLLHDGWNFVETQEAQTVLYRLGDEQGARQELSICRRTRVATLVTCQPKAGRKQTVVYDLVSKEVSENRVVHEYGGLQVEHTYLFLNRREGRLSRSSQDPLAA